LTVAISRALHAQLIDSGVQPEAFAKEFTLWKADWPQREFSHQLFGKDGAYVAPLVDGERYRLRHVHIVPFNTHSRKRWFDVLRRRGRKTSDRHLVYVGDDNGNFGLIYILDEPDAHRVALMRTAKERAVMNAFAIIAENFLCDGSLD
jgi:hypothetical protein